MSPDRIEQYLNSERQIEHDDKKDSGDYQHRLSEVENINKYREYYHF